MGGFYRLLPFLLWPAIVSLPLILTWNDTYASVFPTHYYVTSPTSYWNSDTWPSPVGLSLGIFAVVVGQICVLIYFAMCHGGYFGKLRPIQKLGSPKYDFWHEMVGHLSQPEGFVMLGGYLISTWMFGLMPASYYSFSGGINWSQVAMQLLLTDCLQYLMHAFEHYFQKWIYVWSHKPHHRFTNPKLFDAFNGSVGDTALMILIPLFVTAQLIHANVWTYMTFGTLFANWLCLIHAEFGHSWDRLFAWLNMGTPGHHHVHHKLFTRNYGHLFMYWDIAFGTYKDPSEVIHFNAYQEPSAAYTRKE